MGRWKERARRLKLELFALYLAARHPADRAPLRGRFSWVALAVVWLSVVVIGIAFYI